MRRVGEGGNSLLSKTVQTACEAHPAVSGHQGLSSSGVKVLGREVNHSLPPNAEVNPYRTNVENRVSS